MLPSRYNIGAEKDDKDNHAAKQSSVKQLESVRGWKSIPIRKLRSTIETLLVVGLVVPRLAALALSVVRDTMREVQASLTWSLVNPRTPKSTHNRAAPKWASDGSIISHSIDGPHH